MKHLADHILYQIFKIILSILKKHGEKTDNPSIRTYVNMIENRIIFKIKTGYLLELFNSFKTMKSLGSTKIKVTKDENGKNVPYLEINEVMLVWLNG